MKLSKTPATAMLVLTLSFLGFAGAAGAQTELLRFPDIHGDRVVFTYGGDLWMAPATGGDATRLTAHPGQELFAKFSPDGAHIAFTGQYDGDEQVYVVSSAGGVPERLTYYPARGPLPARWGYDNQVYDWSADGQRILFRSMRYGTDLSDTRLYLVDRTGGLPEPLPMPESGAGDLSPDGARIVYSPLVRDFRTWKRYEGGWAQELYVFDLASHDVERVTDHPRADRDPMWIGDAIYFTSDRSGTNNLYRRPAAGGAVEQLTHGDTWDVRWPSDDGAERIVYELAGQLVVYELSSGRASQLGIRVPDDGLARRPSRVSAEDRIADFELSPKGERALIVARGDVFSVPIEHGPVRNLTHSSGAHDKWARWSPDGSRIAYISDASGEEELYLVDQDGRGEPEQLTRGGAAMRYAPAFAPDGERLAFADKDGKLYVLELGSGEDGGGEPVEIADESNGQIFDYSWSPHGGHLAFSMSEPNDFSSLYIWSVDDGQLRKVTTEMFNESSPAWDPGGDYLYFLSDREFAPQIDVFEWNYALDRTTGVFAFALRRDVEHPFPPRSDEVTVDDAEGDAGEEGEENDSEDGKKKGKGGKGKKGSEDSGDNGDDEKKAFLVIDFDGLAGRVARVPVEADNYGGLVATEDALLYFRGTPFYYGRPADFDPSLEIFSLEDREASRLAEAVRGYAVSADGKKVLVRTAGGLELFSTQPDAKGKRVSTSGLWVDRVPEEEWRQIYDEVWRRFRDFFYVENMHGYDWEALGERYRAKLEHVAHRTDLNYLIGELIAELSVGHAYIAGGDFESPRRPRVALLGALLELDEDAGRYRLAEILQGHNEEERYRSPLTEIGVDAREGDYLMAIDGETLEGGDNPYRLLLHKQNRPVALTLNEAPSLDGAREVVIDPLRSETDLRYLARVARNRDKVAEMTDGRVGYLHIPDMGASGIREFIKYYYAQIRKEGLVVDVRGNGGGNVSQMILERLSRDILGTRFARTRDRPATYPNRVFHGHMVAILDEDSASDGDIFPYRFREAGLGPLIGKRSWGGVVGITNRGTLIDGGIVLVPEFGTNALDGSWIIEGHGVDPDIEVDNDPKAVIAGQDPQLERAVAEVLKAMEADPKVLPERPEPPVKTP